MNLSSFTIPTSARATASRAQFSPLSRRRSAGASSRNNSNSSFASPTVGRTAELPTLRSFWPAGLLDRLQPAVTRYHY